MMTSKLKTIAVGMLFTAAIPAQASFKTFKTYLACPWGAHAIPGKLIAQHNGEDISLDFQKHYVEGAEIAVSNGKVLAPATYEFIKNRIGILKTGDTDIAINHRVHTLLMKHEANVAKAATKTSVTLAVVTVACVAAYKYRKQIAEKLKTLKQRLVKSAPLKA